MKKIILVLMTVPFAMYAVSQQTSSVSSTSQEEVLKSFIQQDGDFTKEKKKEMGLFNFSGNVVYSKIQGETEGYTDGIFGLQLGIQTSILPLGDAFFVDAGLQFSQQGAKYKTYQYTPGEEGGEKELTKRMNYLNLPVTLRYQPNAEEGFYAEAGFQPGLLLSAKLKGASPNEDQKEYFNSFDVGFVMGAGYKINNNLTAGVRVTPGLTNINKSGEYTLNDKHFVVSAGIRYNPFGSGKRD